MQENPGEVDPLLKRCPFCGNQIKKSSYRCPYCHASLAELEERQWKDSTPSSEDDESPEASTIDISGSDAFRTAVLVLAAAVVILVLAALVYLYTRRSNEAAFRPSIEAERIQAPPKLVYPGPPPEDAEPISPPEALPEPMPPQTTPHEREKRIQERSQEILATLRKESQAPPDTLILKSGEQLQCTIIEENPEYLKITYKGVTVNFDRQRVQRIKRRSPADMERELQAIARARATELVDRELQQTALYAASSAEEEPAAGDGSSPPHRSMEKVGEVLEYQGAKDMSFLIPKRAGVTRSFLKEKLGAPDLEYGHVLDYNRKYGFELVLAERDDMLSEIRINTDRFRGRLASGISLSSTAEDVYAAYGKPAAEKISQGLLSDDQPLQSGTLYYNGNFSRIDYKEAGVSFFFLNDKIMQITIR